MNRHFLQSNEWADFQESVGNQSKQVDDIYVYEHRVGPFRYAYIPRVAHMTDAMLQKLSNTYHWARVEGEVTTTYPSVATNNRQPQTTLILDLRPSTDEILASMHKKSRYNIRLAGRKGGTVQQGADVDTFWQLHAETTDRDRFSGHTKGYYEKFLDMPMAEQFTAYVDGVPIAAIITVLHGGVMTYVHGASSNKYRNLMAPYLLQWEAMQYAKQQGATQYDFWGIAPIYPQGEAPSETCYNEYCWEVTHPWTGITRFKVGFGGSVVTYPNAQDIVFRPFIYRIYTLMHTLRYGKK